MPPSPSVVSRFSLESLRHLRRCAVSLLPFAWFAAPILAQTPQPLTGEILVSDGGFPSQPAVATSPAGSFLVVWERSSDSYRRAFGPGGAPSGGAEVLDGGSPAIDADPGGNAVLTRGEVVVLGGRFGIDGVGQGAEFQVNTQTETLCFDSAVARAPNGRFVVSWTAFHGQDGDGYGIFAQRFDALGNRQGGEFQVNTYTTGHQQDSDVSMASDGSFVVSWYRGAASGLGVFARRFASNGNPLGGEFRVDSDLGNGGYFPAVSHDPTGGFMVVWQVVGEEPGGSTLGVFGRRFASNGQPHGGSFRVNQVTASAQREPDLDHGLDGSHVVVWNSNDQDGDRHGVFARHFAQDGSPRGAEFQVNAETVGNQGAPSVAVDAGGDFVVAWTNDFTISARRFFGGAFRDGFESGDVSAWGMAGRSGAGAPDGE